MVLTRVEMEIFFVLVREIQLVQRQADHYQ